MKIGDCQIKDNSHPNPDNRFIGLRKKAEPFDALAPGVLTDYSRWKIPISFLPENWRIAS
jgi:hypothetical protein